MTPPVWPSMAPPTTTTISAQPPNRQSYHRKSTIALSWFPNSTHDGQQTARFARYFSDIHHSPQLAAWYVDSRMTPQFLNLPSLTIPSTIDNDRSIQ